jgi:hypothetical protein
MLLLERQRSTSEGVRARKGLGDGRAGRVRLTFDSIQGTSVENSFKDPTRMQMGEITDDLDIDYASMRMAPHAVRSSSIGRLPARPCGLPFLPPWERRL